MPTPRSLTSDLAAYVKNETIDASMKKTAQLYPALVAFCLLVMLPVLSAQAELPKRDLTVELRQVEEGDSSAPNRARRYCQHRALRWLHRGPPPAKVLAQ